MANRHNPLLMQPDPIAGLRERLQADHDKHQQEEIEDQRLLFEIFHMTDMGKKLYARLEKKYVIDMRVDPTANNAKDVALWQDGFRAAIRGLWENGAKHLQRINEGYRR